MIPFAKKKVDQSSEKEEKEVRGQVATLTISIPFANKFTFDRKGRKRRKTTKFSIPLVGGAGALSVRSLRSSLTRDLSNSQPIVINTKTYRNILKLVSGK